MSVELIGIVTVGVALAGVILTSTRGLRQDIWQDMARLESRLDERIDRLEARLRDDIKQLGDRVGRMEHSQAKLEGLLEGLREAITGRAVHSASKSRRPIMPSSSSGFTLWRAVPRLT